MKRFVLGVLVILGAAACDPYNSKGQGVSQSVSNDPASSGVRVSGYARFGVSGRL